MNNETNEERLARLQEMKLNAEDKANNVIFIVRWANIRRFYWRELFGEIVANDAALLEKMPSFNSGMTLAYRDNSSADDIDDYVKTTYAEELKLPEIMAKILGSKE